MQAFPVPYATDDAVFLCKDKPQVSVRVTVNARSTDIAHLRVRDKLGNGYGLEGLGSQVIAEKAVPQRANPEPAVTVGAEGRDILSLECLREIQVTAEEALVMIGNMETMVCGAHPEIAPAVPEKGTDFRFRNGEGEVGVGLEAHLLARPGIMEEALPDHVHEDGIVLYGIQDVDISFHEPFFCANGVRNGLPLLCAAVQDAQAAHTGEPQFIAAGFADMIGLVGESQGGRQSETLSRVAVELPAAV